MKRIHQLITSLTLVLIVSCVQSDDFSIPEVEIMEQEITGNSNIQGIKNTLEQSGKELFTFEPDDSSIIEGYVISSDEAGNFYKTLIIQDAYEMPTAGVEILIDLKTYFTKYNLGRKIYVKMAGLSMDNVGGKYRIGYNIKNKLEKIPSTLLNDFLIRSGTTEMISPKPISFDEFSEKWIGIYVQVSGVQFKNDELGKTFAGEKFDEFNGERVMLQCENKISSILSTSTFSDFSSNLIPDNKVNISAVLTKDFFAKKFVLVLNDPSTFDFIDTGRCDPEFLNCDSDMTIGSKVIYFENFEEIKKTKDIVELGWTNVNVYFGNEKFKKRSSQGNVSMQISAFNSGENPLEVWLVTPAINLDNYTNEILTFDTRASYDNGTNLTAWVSTDFEGNINSSIWTQLDVKISVGPGGSYENDYLSSGLINLNCLEGDVFIALKYLGGEPGISTTYEVDNFKILGN